MEPGNAGSAGVVGLLSLLLVTNEGVRDTTDPTVIRAMIVYAVYGIGCLVLNLRWRQPIVTYVGLALSIGASLWALAWYTPRFNAMWPAGLAAETLVMAVVAWWLRSRDRQKGTTQDDPANAATTISPWSAFGVPLATTAEVISWAAILLGVWHGWSQRLADPWSSWHPVTGICLAAAYLAMLAATARPYIGQLAGWLLAGSVVALVGRLAAGAPSTNLEMSIALSVTATGTILASIATWIAGQLDPPANRETESNPGTSPWYASLGMHWLHVGLGTAVLAGLIIAFSTTWNTSAVPHYCAVLGAATCFLAARGYRWVGLSWFGSALVFAGLAHALVWTYPQFVAHPLPTALMIHATVALLAGGLLGRFFSMVHMELTESPLVASLESYILKPVRESGVASSFAAVPVLLSLFTDWEHALPTGINLLWLAGIWILVAWARRWRFLFSAGQIAISAGVLFITTSWLVDRPWVDGVVRGLLDPRSLQAYGFALGLLSLIWVAIRLSLRNNQIANHLLHGDRWAIDRLVALALIFGNLALTAWCVAPGIAREWNLIPASTADTAATLIELHGAGAGAWAVVAVLATALVGSLWSRWRNAEILAAYSLCVTAAILLAGRFADATATASALRWALAIAFVLLSATVWLRGRLNQLASSWRANVLHDSQSVPAASAFVLIFAAAPVLVLTVIALLLQVTGHAMASPGGSLFARLPMSVSYLVPVALIVIGLVGYALREKSGEFAFAGGLIAAGTVVGGYLLEAQTIHPLICVQLFTVASAVWAIAWLVVRQRLDVWRESPQNPRARFFMTLQLASPTLGNLFLLLLALFILFAWGELPAGATSVGGIVRETGSLLGWAALGLTVAAWSCRRLLSNMSLRPEIVGLLGMGVIGLAACTVAGITDAWGIDEPWGYITLMVGWALYALAVVSATWYVAAQKFTEREPPPTLLRTAALWVRLAAILAVALGIKGTIFHDLALWSAAAIALASLSGAVMAVWRRREGWAFAAGLGTNLAASILVIDQAPAPGIEWWINLLQANMLATGVIALLWLGVRRRLYGGRDISLTAGPLLGIQVGAGILAQLSLLAIPVVLVLADPAESSRDLAAIARPAGWLAWIVAFAATAWYGWQVARQHIIHVIALGLITLGVMVACTNPVGWSAFHLLLVTWSVSSALLLVFGTLVQWQSQQPESSRSRFAVFGQIPFPVPINTLHTWVLGLMSLIVVMALRGGWSDPSGPFWSAGAVLSVALLAGAIAILQKNPSLANLSGLILCISGSLLWWHRLPPHTFAEFALANVIALSLGSIVWSLLGLGWSKVNQAMRPANARAVYPELSVTLSVLMLAGTVGAALLSDLEVIASLTVSGAVAWTAMATTVVALFICLRSAPLAIVRSSLFVTGMTAVGLLIHQQPWAPPRVLWAVGWSMAAYALVTTLIDRTVASHAATRRWLHLDEDEGEWATNWFVMMQTVLCLAVVPLSIWITLDSTPFAVRVAGPLAMTMLSVAGFLVADRNRGATRGGWQFFALGSLALLLAEWGWAVWPLAGQRLLEGSVVLMTALGTSAGLCGWLSTRRFPDESGWGEASRTATVTHGILGLGGLVSVLVQEAMLFQAGKGTEMALAAVLMVAATFVLLMVASLFLALSTQPDPFGLSMRGRQAYVYAVEVMIALLCAHFYCTIPELFQTGIFRDYWLFWMMVIAFGGATLSHLFESRGVPVLAEPLRVTALALPVLPAIGFWLPIDTTTSPFLWFLVSAFYAFHAHSRKSVWWGVVSAACANMGLWVTWYELNFPFFTNPQLWLIPPALAALIAEYLNHDRLKPNQSTATRYFALSVIYVSSTADMFIAGVGESLILPLVLAFLSVAGVMAGILLRVRAFLLLGVSFLMVVIMTMIWYAAVDLEHTWVWYVSGIVLGIGIIAMFAIFEKRRNDVLATIERLRTWD